MRANDVVRVVGFHVPGVLDGDFSRDGCESLDGRSDGVRERASVIGGVAHDIEPVALVEAAPFLVANVEGDTGGVDGDVIAHGAFQLPLDDATDLSSVLGAKTLKLFSDFHPRRPFSGLRRGAFVIFIITLRFQCEVTPSLLKKDNFFLFSTRLFVALPIIFYFTFFPLIRDKYRKRYAR